MMEVSGLESTGSDGLSEIASLHFLEASVLINYWSSRLHGVWQCLARQVVDAR